MLFQSPKNRVENGRVRGSRQIQIDRVSEIKTEPRRSFWRYIIMLIPIWIRRRRYRRILTRLFNDFNIPLCMFLKVFNTAKDVCNHSGILFNTSFLDDEPAKLLLGKLMHVLVTYVKRRIARFESLRCGPALSHCISKLLIDVCRFAVWCHESDLSQIRRHLVARAAWYTENRLYKILTHSFRCRSRLNLFECPFDISWRGNIRQ